MKRSIYILLFLFFTYLNLNAEDKVIVMGYKEKDKMPLIGKKGDDSGLYKELFEKAAKKIGYELKIVRYPKKRVHAGLKAGVFDFYPGASFSKKRAEYLYYLPNGLQTKEVLVSLDDKEEITDMKQAKGKLLIAPGSSKVDWDKKYSGIKIVQMGKLPMKTVIQALKAKRGDFYIADIEVVDYYLKQNNIKNYKDIGIKIHQSAVNKWYIPMYMGFSRNSRLFEEVPNPLFEIDEELSIANFPVNVSKSSIAYRLYKALREFEQSGETKKIYGKYFK